MNELGIASIIANGLGSFAQSYTAAKNQKNDQIAREEQRAMARRQQKMEEKKSGLLYNEASGDFEADNDGSGSVQSKRQLDAAKGLLSTLESQYKALGEDAQDTARGRQLHAEIQKAGDMATAIQRRMMGGSVAPIGSGGYSSPEDFDFKDDTVVPRDLDQTMLPTGQGVGISKQQVQPSPVMQARQPAPVGAPKPGLVDRTSTIPAVARLSSKDRKKLRFEEAKNALELDQKETGEIRSAIGKQKVIANALESGFEQLNDPKITEDEKIIIGREMLKTLNSQQGADAIGAEEAKRLGSLLEFQLFNFRNPGPAFGRDIPGFTKQVGNNLTRLRSSISKNEGLLGGQQPLAPQTKNVGGKTYRKVPGGWEEVG